MARGSPKKAQLKVMSEIRNQLLIQADLLGIRHQYSPLAIEELHLDSAKKILSNFYMERANLQYEMDFLGGSKKEVQVKLFKLERYIQIAHTFIERSGEKIHKLIEKGAKDKEKFMGISSRIDGPRKISLMLGKN